jgi:hypothetical protein
MGEADEKSQHPCHGYFFAGYRYFSPEVVFFVRYLRWTAVQACCVCRLCRLVAQLTRALLQRGLNLALSRFVLLLRRGASTGP